MDQSQDTFQQGNERMDASYQQLSDTQQIVLNILPIPGAIISIVSSAAIIYLARERVKRAKRCSPYTRLLVALSTCDILFSLTIAIATFLRPRDTSFRIWAFGNDASCSLIAFMNQLSTAGGIWYSGMLSFYFLFTTRYGMKNARISKCLEPFMHIFAVGYAIATAIFGSMVGVYGEKVGVMACWTSRYSNEAVYDLVGLLFYGVPVVVVFICLLINNIKIYRFVRRHTREVSSQASDTSTRSSKSGIDLQALDCSVRLTPSSTDSPSEQELSDSDKARKPSKRKRQRVKRKPATMLTSQSQRLQLVFSQSILFVLSFLVCHFWNFIMGILQDSAMDHAEDMVILKKYYYWAALQAAFLPMQGFFNMIIYVRPKYLILRLEFPSEPRLWTWKRVFRGKQLPPTSPSGVGMEGAEMTLHRQHEAEDGVVEPVQDTHNPISSASRNRVPREMVSSMTASDGDFESIVEELGDDERWVDTSSPRVERRTLADLAAGISGLNRLTNLEAISELSETVFELTPYQVNGSHLSVISDGVSIPTESSESRWKGTETSVTSRTTVGSLYEAGSDDSDGRPKSGIDSRPAVPARRKSDSDSPVQPPKRTVEVGRVSDSPISIPRRSSDVPTGADSLPKSKQEPNSKHGQSGKRASDKPLARPERLISEIEIEDA